MDYPTFLYRCPGPHFGPQWTTYDTRDVLNDEDMAAALADGWCETLQEAAAQYIAQRDEAAKAVLPKVQDEAPAAAEEDAPPTRAEMLEQAERIGLKVDKRWSEETLLARINAAMAPTNEDPI